MPWIRTQDKKDLSNCDTILKSMVRNYGFTLGEFPTEAAALAELDAIDRWIEKGTQGVYQIPPKEMP